MTPRKPPRKTFTLIDAPTDEHILQARRHCAALTASYGQFTNGAETALRPGMFAQWKPGMKNRKVPAYGEPAIVLAVLPEPLIDDSFESGSVYFREQLDLILGFHDEDEEFVALHYDARRFEAYDGAGMDPER